MGDQMAFDYEAGTLLPLHAHARHQLLYAREGVMRVRTGAGIWVVPTNRTRTRQKNNEYNC